jgi:hypothetical protein
MMGRVMTLFLGRTTSLTGAAVLLASTAAIIPTAAASPPERPSPTVVRLAADEGGVVRSATVDLSDRTWSRARASSPIVTLRTDAFSMVAATWHGADPRLKVRTLGRDGWTSWRHVHPLSDGPSRSAVHGASDLFWVDDSTGVQVRSEGATPDDLDLVLIDPGHLPTDDATPTPVRPLTKRVERPRHAPAPPLMTRRDWGANNKWRNGKPHYLDKLKQVHVHHTATGNSYSRKDVPGILRGIYRYHAQTLGWFDIGYNFLVDRFGRAWIGRSGGAERLVRGAHTLGFNRQSVGIAVIGNLEDRRAWPEAVKTVAALAAWKLDTHDREATGKVMVTSSGSDKYPDRDRVRLPVIDGHRDTNDTACPGDRLYAKLPEIRRRAQWRIDHW